MSALTEEFKDAIAELAVDLGEGVTATLIQFPATATFAPESQRYADSTPTEFVFTCHPPTAAVGTVAGMSEVQRGILTLVIPTEADDGTAMTPRTGDRMRFNSVIYQLVSADPIYIGTGICGYLCEVRQ